MVQMVLCFILQFLSQRGEALKQTTGPTPERWNQMRHVSTDRMLRASWRVSEVANLVRIDGRAPGSGVEPLTLFEAPGGPFSAYVHHPSGRAFHARVCHGPAGGSLQPGISHGASRGPHHPTLQHSAGGLLSLQGTAGGLVPPEFCAGLSEAVGCAGVSVDQRIGCEPFRNVFIVGRRSAFVGAVGKEARQREGLLLWQRLHQGHWFYWAIPGQWTRGEGSNTTLTGLC